MIRFSLRCKSDHEFEGWFRSGDSFEAQQQAGEIACPECGDTAVEKALMAPAISRGKSAAPQLTPAQMKTMLVALRRQVESNCDYVGERFAEEARRIHHGEVAQGFRVDLGGSIEAGVVGRDSVAAIHRGRGNTDHRLSEIIVGSAVVCAPVVLTP